MTDAILEIDGVEKHFGGLAALGGVHAAVERGRLTAVIGPNGAGKTTLFNVISGIVPPSAGRVRFLGQDITHLPVHAINRLGLARTLQIKSVFPGMTVLENLWIAAQSRDGVFKPFRRAAAAKRANRVARDLCDELGLGPLADQPAANLSYGDVALLEIGIALATEPKLLLLDEPICGMGPAETEQTVAKIKQLAARIDIVIIEHDIEVVFGLCDEVIVMALGKVLARGTPAEIAKNPEVRSAYLGDDDA
jgi:branched-chain amino acid transport system ATP-binding protein